MNKTNNSTDISLLKFQIGPVQDFIAAARSTRDLWSGSYLLSWLVAEGMKTLQSNGGKIIFPTTKNQPLFTDTKENQKLLIPNLPNIFVATVLTNEAKNIANLVSKSIANTWEEIAQSVWEQHVELGIDVEYKERFNHQVNHFIDVAWQATPYQTSYAETYRNNGWQLNATRQLRMFHAPLKEQGLSNEKDSLTGELEEIMINHQSINHEFKRKNFFKHENDHLSAISLVKRLWHATYLGKNERPNADNKHFIIPSIPDLAARELIDECESKTNENSTLDSYISAIAFDGDSIGKWMGGEYHDDESLKQFHQDFSQCLSQFAIEMVPKIIKENDGFLIYAGGDDVLAILPADASLTCVKALREAFRECTKTVAINGVQPDASVGISIAHVKSPLQDLIRQAVVAEKRAKNHHQRSAFSINLMKRSGELNQWGGKWADHSIDLFAIITKAMNDNEVSKRFPNRVCQLLEPYLELESNTHSIDDQQIILKEVLFSATNQGSIRFAETISALLDKHLSSIGATNSRRNLFQHKLDSIIGLCKTIAFVHRNK